MSFPEREAVYAEIMGQTKVFCCNGCMGIYRLINEEGLDRFYKQRDWKDGGVSYSIFTKEIDIKPFAGHVKRVDSQQQADDGLMEIDVFIDGIRCASCVWLNERILAKTAGIEYARVNYATHRAKIRWNPDIIGLDGIIKRILSIGYEPKPYSESEQFKIQKSEARDLLIRFGTAAFLSSQLMIYSIALYAGYFQGMETELKLILEIIAMILTIPVIFYSGMPFIKTTIRGLRRLNFNMDSLITIGAGSAFVYSVYEIFTGGKVYFDTSAMIITLILLGRYIETTAKGKASQTIEMLMELMPKEATIIVNDSESPDGGRQMKTVPISSIIQGDMVYVKPGERIPLDGVVLEGISEADESIITGESRPASKGIGDNVIAGSVNLYGSIIFRTTKTANETALAGIIRAVEDAQARKPRIQRVADIIVGVFVPAIIAIAIATVLYYLISGASYHKALMTGVSVLVVACPCGLGLATPLAVLIFTVMASLKGILIRSGDVIENASRLTHVIFDKTGTLTVGKPVLREIISVESTDKDYLLRLAASIERHSEHSIGHAIHKAWGAAELFDVKNFRAVPGKGAEGTADGRKVIIGSMNFMKENSMSFYDARRIEDTALQFEGRGDTVVYAGWDGNVRGAFVISDMMRSEAPEVVRSLANMGINVYLVSGDN
ncbi:MAG: cation-translocating P-type ATPase, partial [Nitrospirae bacterium]|nr:cation-translocating P-type ATPase [Nitrospirota bacterium]